MIAFPKLEIANNIKKILAQSGYTVSAVCPTGAAALSAMEQLECGIIVCGYRFSDMLYQEIFEYMPSEFTMLLVASADHVLQREIDHLMCLSMPLKVHELLQTLEMMEYTIARRRKRKRLAPKERSEEELQTIAQAKRILMERNGFTEQEAHRYIQKRSMDNATSMMETAQMILSLMGDA